MPSQQRTFNYRYLVSYSMDLLTRAKTPIYTPDASVLTVSIFRATDNRKVWYEWMVEAWSNLMGGGVGGGIERRKIRLGVSEIGSSKGGGCMM